MELYEDIAGGAGRQASYAKRRNEIARPARREERQDPAGYAEVGWVCGDGRRSDVGERYVTGIGQRKRVSRVGSSVYRPKVERGRSQSGRDYRSNASSRQRYRRAGYCDVRIDRKGAWDSAGAPSRLEAHGDRASRRCGSQRGSARSADPHELSRRCNGDSG